MNLRFVEAFLWVARLKSFKGAAEKLHTTQAAISSRIATLEEELGARLFERDNRSVTLTFRGTELVPLAERMLENQSIYKLSPERLASLRQMGLQPGAVTVTARWARGDLVQLDGLTEGEVVVTAPLPGLAAGPSVRVVGG